MDIVNFLEQLAKNVHHCKAIENLINQQHEEIKKAVYENNCDLLKDQIDNKTYLATVTTIVQI